MKKPPAWSIFRNEVGYFLEGGGGGGASGFYGSRIRTKLAMDYGFLTSSPLDCGFEMVIG